MRFGEGIIFGLLRAHLDTVPMGGTPNLQGSKQPHRINNIRVIKRNGNIFKQTSKDFYFHHFFGPPDFEVAVNYSRGVEVCQPGELPT